MINLKDIMTPKEILNGNKHERPFVIFVEDFPTFKDLYKVRHEIRDLRLVPLKSDEIYNKYHSVDKEELLRTVDFGNNDIFISENEFPYMLPPNTSQNLIWIKDGVEDSIIENYLHQIIKEIGTEEVILFERPINIDTFLVKGSFPQIRHIHFWYEKNL